MYVEGQRDLKRLVACTSVSHMGFVLLGIFAGNATALSGAVMQMLAHGVSTGALFLIVGMVQERVHSRELGRMGGFWSSAPRLSAAGLVFCLASLGLPGSGNFVAEFLVLIGTWSVSMPLTAVTMPTLPRSARNTAVIRAMACRTKLFNGPPANAIPPVRVSGRCSASSAWMICAGFKAGDRNGHHFINRSGTDAVLLVVGSRNDADYGEYPDIDMKFGNGRYAGKGGFTRKDGTPY